MCLLFGVLMEKLLGNKDCWTKSLEKCSKTCFSTEVAAFKSRSWRAAMCIAVMYNVQYVSGAMYNTECLCSLLKATEA